MTDQQIEQEIQDKGKTAPRITPADIEANIMFEGYFSAWEGTDGGVQGKIKADATEEQEHAVRVSLCLLTICTIVLRNGFTCIGTSSCASPANFDPEIGRKIARQKALEDVWKVMGYELRTKLAEAGQ